MNYSTESYDDAMDRTFKICSLKLLPQRAIDLAIDQGTYKGHTMSISNPPNQCKERLKLLGPVLGDYGEFQSNGKVVRFIK